MTHVARVKRIRRGVVAVVAAAAVGGVVGSLPVVHHAQVQPTVTAIDPASLYNSAQQKFASGDVAGGLESLKQSLICLLYTSPSPRDATLSRMPSSA